MNTFAIVLLVAAIAVGTLAKPAPEPSKMDAFAEAQQQGLVQYEPILSEVDQSDLNRQKKSYAPPSYAPAPSYAPPKLTYSAPAPAIPCSKAVILSCAPSIIPAPCSAPSY